MPPATALRRDGEAERKDGAKRLAAPGRGGRNIETAAMWRRRGAAVRRTSVSEKKEGRGRAEKKEERGRAENKRQRGGARPRAGEDAERRGIGKEAESRRVDREPG